MSKSVAINSIRLPDRIQPRRYFDKAAIESLTRSIEKNGLMNPLVVRQRGRGYELIAGERRLRACRSLGFKKISVTVVEANDVEAWELALAENMTRESLNPIEESEGILYLLSESLELEPKAIVSVMNVAANNAKASRKTPMTEAQAEWIAQIDLIFSRLSMTRESYRTNRLPLLSMAPDMQEAIQDGLEYTKAKAIARIPAKTDRVEMIRLATERKLSLRAVREECDRRLEIKPRFSAKDAFPRFQELLELIEENPAVLTHGSVDQRLRLNEVNNAIAKALELL